jgi:hypothetical protein
MAKPTRTQWFNAKRTTPSPRKPGRYLALPEGKTKPVFRWWNGAGWQYNRRKVNAVCGFGNRPGDVWAGAAVRLSSSHSSLAK